MPLPGTLPAPSEHAGRGRHARAASLHLAQPPAASSALNLEARLRLAIQAIVVKNSRIWGAPGVALVTADDLPGPLAAGQPRCIKCNGTMTLVRTEPKDVFNYRYELRTFQCDRCGFAQTYTMGRS